MNKSEQYKMGELATTPPTPLLPTLFKWAKDGNTTTSVSSTHILSDLKRPLLSALIPGSIPIIDLSEPEEKTKAKVVYACQEYGIFYLVNHGVDEVLCNNVLDAIVEFFSLPLEQGRAQLCSNDFEKDVKVVTYCQDDGDRNVPVWSEALTHLWHPSEESFIDALPADPPHYRELIRRYAKEMGVLTEKVLGWMSEGLGLEKKELEKRIGEKPKYYKMQCNYYPPCPEPDLTLGLPVHNDMAALTIIRQSEHVTGLHFLKDDKWMAVQPLTNAFVCNVGDVIEVLSNGKYKSVRHRAVTSENKSRVSLATFVAPNKQTMVGPIEDILDENNPPRYQAFLYANFHERFLRPWLYPYHSVDDQAM